MEIPPNTISIEREFNIKKEKTAQRTSSFLCKTTENHISVTVSPCWNTRIKKIHDLPQTIQADSVAVLNLNHICAYGHIYTEVISELFAVNDTYKDYDCVLTCESPLINEVINTFQLKLSNKIKFLRSNEQFILDCQKIKIVNHCPKSYPNKTQNILKLKKAFHDAFPIGEQKKKLLLYCSRNNKKTAAHSRKLTHENENKVVEILKQYAFKNDLDFYFWNGLESDETKTPILKQYELFSSAKLVVGVHGGAFSNIIFLDPSKRPSIIEFCPLPNKTFDYLSNKAFSEFAIYYKILFQLPLEAKNLPKRKIIDYFGKTDSTIDLSELEAFLNKIE